MNTNILSIGEAVWDIFPQNRVLGGAPLNVAYHLGCLGLSVILVSRVGDDELGKAARRRVKKLGLSAEGLQVDDELPTGRVLVTAPRDNEPHFEIVAPAAWDNIAVPPADLAGDGFALVFGTLGQRDPCSRRAIRSLWPQAAYRFYDVNLRPPFTTRELVAESLAAADMAKVNGGELTILGQWFEIAATDKFEIARQLVLGYSLDAVVVTEGAAGAWLFTGADIFTVAGEPVAVADTVGAGDAFFAALIAGFIHKTPWEQCLKTANERGAYVASCHGATPPMR